MLATFTSNQHETTFKTFTLILIYYETNKTLFSYSYLHLWIIKTFEADSKADTAVYPLTRCLAVYFDEMIIWDGVCAIDTTINHKLQRTTLWGLLEQAVSLSAQCAYTFRFHIFISFYAAKLNKIFELTKLFPTFFYIKTACTYISTIRLCISPLSLYPHSNHQYCH